MKVTALEAPPMSGSIDEHWFVERDGDTWFKFETDAGTEWAGLFSSAGLLPEKTALAFSDGRTVLINAGGDGHVVDVESAELLYQTNVLPLVGAIAVPGQDFIIACNFTGVVALGRAAELWRSPRIASDGIELGSATASALAGRVFRWTDWHDFTLTFEGWRLDVEPL